MKNYRQEIKKLNPNKPLSFVVIYEEKMRCTLFDCDLNVYNNLMHTQHKGQRLTLTKEQSKQFLYHLEQNRINFLHLTRFGNVIRKTKVKHHLNNQYFMFSKHKKYQNKSTSASNKGRKDLSIIKERDKSFVNQEVQKKKDLKKTHKRNINDPEKPTWADVRSQRNR